MTREQVIRVVDAGLAQDGSSLKAVLNKHRASVRDLSTAVLVDVAKNNIKVFPALEAELDQQLFPKE